MAELVVVVTAGVLQVMVATDTMLGPAMDVIVIAAEAGVVVCRAVFVVDDNTTDGHSGA